MKSTKLFSLVTILMVILTGSTTYGIQILNPSFSKPAGETDETKQYTQLNIGLLIPDSKALAAKQGAELAIREANEGGGYSGHPFHLVVRTTDGLWGAGSNESVSLVFEDQVLAYMGSLDGRNAHLAEQVATKTRVAFLSTWATDMTLSYAFVPWFFRCVPDDKQQATTLIQEIYRKRKINNVALIGTEMYDSRYAIRAFVKVAKSMNVTEPSQFLFKPSDQNFNKTLSDIDKSGIEAIVLFGNPALASDIIPLMRQRNMRQPVFGTLSLLDDQKARTPDWNILENVIIVSSDQWFTKKGVDFQKRFQEVYGYQPGPVAAYAYDGANIIIEIIRKTGPDRDKIIDALSNIKYLGVTGEIQFDNKGNRDAKTGLMKLNNGNPIPIEEN